MKIRNLRTKTENPGKSSAAAADTNEFSSKFNNCVFKNHTKCLSSDQDGSSTPQYLEYNVVEISLPNLVFNRLCNAVM